MGAASDGARFAALALDNPAHLVGPRGKSNVLFINQLLRYWRTRLGQRSELASLQLFGTTLLKRRTLSSSLESIVQTLLYRRSVVELEITGNRC